MFLQDADGGPQGRDGDAGAGVPGQSEAHRGGEDRLRLSGPDPLQQAWHPDASHSPPAYTGTKGSLDQSISSLKCCFELRLLVRWKIGETG